MPATTEAPHVAKKKAPAAPEPARRYGSLIRVSDEFAEAINDAASIRKQSVRDLADELLLGLVRKAYTDKILEAAEQIQKGKKK